MLSKLKQLFKRRGRFSDADIQFDDDPELSWLNPPADPHDVGAWDRYWVEQVTHGLGPPLFDMFCDDRELVEVMNGRAMHSVLCAGSGISQEPRALAEAGFEVHALDCSAQAMSIAESFEFPAHGFEQYCNPDSRRSGGSVEFVVGDILEKSICPGPFDAIIERRTVQVFSPPDRAAMLSALADRLDREGIFLSHCHDAAWRPPAEPRHFTESWFRENGWSVWKGASGSPLSGRVAWLWTTTG